MHTSVADSFLFKYLFQTIQVHYTSENVVEGKSAAKKALQQKLGLQEIDVPIVGIVTRLTAQKGIHLIKHAIHRTLEWNGQVPPLHHSKNFEHFL
jgi:glycogen synthase